MGALRCSLSPPVSPRFDQVVMTKWLAAHGRVAHGVSSFAGRIDARDALVASACGRLLSPPKEGDRPDGVLTVASRWTVGALASTRR